MLPASLTSATAGSPSKTAYPDEYKILFAAACLPSKLPAAVRQLIVRIFEVAVIDDVDKRMQHKKVRATLENSDQDITYNIIDQTRLECQRGKFDTNLDPIDVFYKHLNCQIEPLETNSSEFKMIQQYFDDGYAPKTTQTSRYYSNPMQNPNSPPLLQYVYRLDRHGEHERFTTTSHGTSNDRQLLWHGSPMTNFGGILSQGLRVAPKGVRITGAAYGAGIYFSDSICFSEAYTHRATTRDIGMFLVCEVADAMRGTRQTRVLTERRDVCDVTVGIPTGVTDGGAIYVAPYVAQVRMRYLVQVGYGKRPPPASLEQIDKMLSESNDDPTRNSAAPMLLKRSELREMHAARMLAAAGMSKIPLHATKSEPKSDVFPVKRNFSRAEVFRAGSTLSKRNHIDSGTVDSGTADSSVTHADEEDVDDDFFELADEDDDFGFDIGEPGDHEEND